MTRASLNQHHYEFSPTTTLLVILLGISGCSTAPVYESGKPEPTTTMPTMTPAPKCEAAADSVVVDEPPFDWNTLAEALNEIASLGETPTVFALASTLSSWDEWLVAPEEEADFQQLKNGHLDRLRRNVVTDVQRQQDAALNAATSAAASSALAEAAQSLVLYPISDDPDAIDEARRLSARQADVSRRLQVLTRVRYNSWAVDQLDKARKYYVENKSWFDSKNAKIIDPLVQILSPLDTLYFEPVVQGLYSDFLKTIQDSLSPENYIRFAKRLTNPKIERKTLGDI